MNFKPGDKVIFIGLHDGLRDLHNGLVYTIISMPLKNNFTVLDNGYTVKRSEIVPLSIIKENVPVHLRGDLNFLDTYGKWVLSCSTILNYTKEEFIIKKIEDKDTWLISPKNYRNLTFSVSPEMCIFDERSIALSKFNIGDEVWAVFSRCIWEIVDYQDDVYLCYNQSFSYHPNDRYKYLDELYKDTKYYGHLNYYKGDMLELVPKKEVKNYEDNLDALKEGVKILSVDLAREHKGCKFENNDFYRAFTNKNGHIIFNQVKVSTVCICTVEDASGEKNIFFAKYNGERIKKQSTMVKFKNGMIGEVNDSFKIMDKYLKGMVMTLNLYTTNIMYPIQEIVEVIEPQKKLIGGDR